MRVATAAQRAHQRLSEQLPKRTHEWTPIRGQWGIKRTPEETEALTAQLLEAKAAGMSQEEMRATFCISQYTVYKLIGRP